MTSRALTLVAVLALLTPSSAMAADANGGTGIPLSGNGGVHSIPGEPPVPVAPVAPTGPAPARAAGSAPAAPGDAARQAQAPAATASGETGGGVLTVPVPKSPPVRARPRATAPVAGVLASTGFDLGVVACTAMLMVGAGLLMSAALGPRRQPR